MVSPAHQPEKGEIWEVDLCSVATNCPDRKSLPCGMVLRAYFPAGLGISENVGSRQMGSGWGREKNGNQLVCLN